MKCLAVIGRREIENAYPKFNPECVISIKDIAKQFEQPVLDFSGPKLLLEFEDWERDVPGAPTDEDVNHIITFGEEHKVKTFVVNCEAGVSRSAATALILQHIGGKPLEANFEDITIRFERVFPNGRMVRLASKLLQDDDLWFEYINWESLWLKRFEDRQRMTTGYYPREYL